MVPSAESRRLVLCWISEAVEHRQENRLQRLVVDVRRPLPTKPFEWQLLRVQWVCLRSVPVLDSDPGYSFSTCLSPGFQLMRRALAAGVQASLHVRAWEKLRQMSLQRSEEW